MPQQMGALAKQAAEDLGSFGEKIVCECDGDPRKLSDAQLQKMIDYYRETEKPPDSQKEWRPSPDAILRNQAEPNHAENANSQTRKPKSENAA